MRRIPGMRPLYVESTGALWASRGMRVYRSQDHGRSFEFVARYRGDVFQRLSRASRLVERFTRSGFHSLVPLSDGSCVATIRGAILKRAAGSTRFRRVFRITRGSRPMNICLLPNGTLVWGEYFFNRERDEVHIYGSDDGGESWEVVYTFPRGSIRHVHGIVYDRFRDGCWVLTGDEDSESKVLFTRDDFQSLESVFEGSQKFRTVAVIPRMDYLVIGTDSPFQQNYVQRLEPETGRVSRVLDVTGTVLDCNSVGGWLVISVSAEPSRVNTCRCPTILVSKDTEKWSQLHSAERDIWHLPYSRFIPTLLSERAFFQHPVYLLAKGESNAGILYASGQAVSGDDNCLLVWDLNEQYGMHTGALD